MFESIYIDLRTRPLGFYRRGRILTVCHHAIAAKDVHLP